jgi:hypothetical protein
MNLSDKMVGKCEDILRGLNIVFYIRKENGTELINGDISVKVKKTRSPKRKSNVPYGTFTNMLRNLGIEELKDGGIIRIDCGEYHPVRIRAVACAYAFNNWGKGTATTSVEGNEVVLMRHAPLEV